MLKINFKWREKKHLLSVLIVFVLMVLLGGIFLLVVNKHIINYSQDYIFSEIKDMDEESLKELDCIIVLGAGLKADGKPNLMLKDRLDKAIELYYKGYTNKFLLSGDNGQDDYDEVNAMKQYVLDKGVKEEDIFLDHAGFSTYESMYRAKKIFQVKKAIVITQKYHQYRAVYIARKLGIDMFGVCAEEIRYFGQNKRAFREVLARNKDFLTSIRKVKPKYLGRVIPIGGDGRETFD